MSNKSKAGRILLLPFFFIVWLTWLILSGLALSFGFLDIQAEKLMRKFNDFIDKHFPLG